MEIKIKKMQEENLHAVLEIEADTFAPPWSRNLFLKDLQNEYSQSYIAYLTNGQIDNKIVGYICNWFIHSECNILKLACINSYRRRGVATKLLDYSLREARQRGAGVILLEVRPSNVAALALYRKFGFMPVGIRKDYYRETNEDAVIMVLRMPATIIGNRSKEVEGLF